MHRQCFKEGELFNPMKIELSTKPKSPTIIGGFPGFGLVGMIATEYLINHLIFPLKPIDSMYYRCF